MVWVLRLGSNRPRNLYTKFAALIVYPFLYVWFHGLYPKSDVFWRALPLLLLYLAGPNQITQKSFLASYFGGVVWWCSDRPFWCLVRVSLAHLTARVKFVFVPIYRFVSALLECIKQNRLVSPFLARMKWPSLPKLTFFNPPAPLLMYYILLVTDFYLTELIGWSPLLRL